MKNYKNLIVYQKSVALSKDIFNYLNNKKVPRIQEFLILQLLRAITSVGANIAEGFGRYHVKSYRNFLSIARGSNFEVDYWLDMAQNLNIIDNGYVSDLKARNDEVSKMLTTMMKKLENK